MKPYPHFIPFAKPSISQAACDEVVACLRSGWITTGPRTKQFEQDLSAYCQAPFVSCLNSATAGLHLALKALNLQPGDEVITSAHTFVASLNTIVLAGGKPVLVDIDRDSRNMSVDLLAAAITNKTKAIMPVHFAGFPVDLDPLYDLAKQHNLRVIEDAAQAIGTAYKGKKLGSFGDTQVFSFHPNKNMTTGEGGCVTTRDENLIKAVNISKFHGIDRDAFNRFSKNGKQTYDVIEPGFKYNMLDMQAALGLHQLAALDDFNQRRTAKAQVYQTALQNIDALSLPSLPEFACTPSWHLYTVLVDPQKMSRSDFIEAMRARNIGVGLHYQPVSLFSYYQQLCGFKAGDFPIAEAVGEQIVSLPLFPDLSEEEQQFVIAAIKEVLA